MSGRHDDGALVGPPVLGEHRALHFLPCGVMSVPVTVLRGRFVVPHTFAGQEVEAVGGQATCRVDMTYQRHCQWIGGDPLCGEGDQDPVGLRVGVWEWLGFLLGL